MCNVLTTERLILRQWKDQDRDAFAALNNDPTVMRYFPRYFSRTESDSFVDANIEHIDEHGWGSWAVERKDTQEFIGFVGFSEPASWHPCAGRLEIGWRLARRTGVRAMQARQPSMRYHLASVDSTSLKLFRLPHFAIYRQLP